MDLYVLGIILFDHIDPFNPLDRQLLLVYLEEIVEKSNLFRERNMFLLFASSDVSNYYLFEGIIKSFLGIGVN